MLRGGKLLPGDQDQPPDPPLARSVRKGGAAPYHSGPGYDEQHHPTPRLLHQGNGVLQQQEAAGEVDVDHPPPGFLRVLVDAGRRIEEDGRGIDQDVEAVEALARGLHQPADVRGPAEIGVHEAGRAPFFADLPGRRFPAGLVDVGQDEPRPFAGGAYGGGAAEAGGGAGDDCCLVFKFHAPAPEPGPLPPGPL